MKVIVSLAFLSLASAFTAQQPTFALRSTSSAMKSETSLQAALEAILFDCDGVLADTERDGHRLAFNRAFKNSGIDEEWSVELYGKLLETGGGKERMTAHWNEG